MLVLTVVILASLKISSYVAVTLSLSIGLIISLLWKPVFSGAMAEASSPLIYLSLPFYVLASTVLFVAWLCSFLYNRLQYWRFQPQLIVRVRKNVFRPSTRHPAGSAHVSVIPADTLQKLAGFGVTKDIRIVIPNTEEGDILIKNVWCAESKVDEITPVIQQRITSTKDSEG